MSAESKIDLSTRIGPNELAVPVYNASGCLCATKTELDALGDSESGAIVTKSCTLEAQAGNPKPRYYEWAVGSINSMGLPNKGYEFYAEFYEASDDTNKPYFISIAGRTSEEAIDMVTRFIAKNYAASRISNIELNVSYPNIPGKPQLGYDFNELSTFLKETGKAIRKLLGNGKVKNQLCLGVKLPPYFDPIHFDRVAKILKRNANWISFVTCINSLGNGLIINPYVEKPMITAKGGLGGVGGFYCKPTALANVAQFYARLKDVDVSIIGCGGVHSGTDVFEHILCGATAVQVGTCLIGMGPEKCFEKLNSELREIMNKKGYTSLDEFRGKLWEE